MSPHPKAKAIMSTHRKTTMASSANNSDTSKRGLAILFAAIDYHQSTTSSSSSFVSPTSMSSSTFPTNPFGSNTMDHRMRNFIESRAVNPAMLDEEALMVGFAFPQRGNNVDIQWIDEGNLSLRQRKLNRRSWKRFQSKQQKQNSNKKLSAEMALSIPLPDSLTVVESSPVIVHATVSPSSSIGSTPTTFDDQASVDDGSVGIAPASHSDSLAQEDATQSKVYQPIPSSPRRISIETVDGFDALLKRQQQRLYFMSQKTKRSRAMLHGMTVLS